MGFFIFFLFELIVKLGGIGRHNYFKDKFNWFDAAIVLVSALDIALVHLTSSDSSSGALTAFRIFRLVRVF